MMIMTSINNKNNKTHATPPRARFLVLLARNAFLFTSTALTLISSLLNKAPNNWSVPGTPLKLPPAAQLYWPGPPACPPSPPPCPCRLNRSDKYWQISLYGFGVSPMQRLERRTKFTCLSMKSYWVYELVRTTEEQMFRIFSPWETSVKFSLNGENKI